MRILVASDTYHPHVNGASYFTTRLAHALLAAGHDVAVIAPSRTLSHEDEMRGNVHVYGVRSFSAGFVHNFRFVLPFVINKRIREGIKDFRPDIVHIQSHFLLSRTTLKEARRLKIPVVVTNHFMPENLTHYLRFPRFITNVLNKVMWKDAVRIYHKAHGVSSPTESGAQSFKRHWEKSVHIISNGIDLKRFNPDNDAAPARNEYRLPDKPILLFVGRLDKEKQVDVVLRAVALASADTNFHFVIAGNGMEKKNLQALANRLGIGMKVTFIGFVPDELLPSLYAAADCFAIAGIAELQCIVAMEAMATGLPVLAARAVALPELVHDDENGFLFEPGNAEELASHIEKIFSDPEMRRHMGLKSLEIIAPHEINITVEAFEDFYRQALASSVP